MIKSLTVTNFLGEKIKMELREPEKSGFLITSIDGLGPVKATINTTEVSTNDGSIFNSARLSQRNIVMHLIFLDKNGESIEDVRQRSYKFFPLKKKLKIVIETDNRTLQTEGYVESNEPDIFSKQEGTQISILCPDPYLYSTDEDGKHVTYFYSVEPLFEFPFENASLSEDLIEFGDIDIRTEGVITYTGDADVGITIFIHAIGSASDITIYNVDTREQMVINTSKIEQLTGHAIIASDDIEISTIKGSKHIHLIRNGITYNILNCLSKDADWFTITKGDNTFAFTAESGVTNLQFRIENRVVFEGV